MKYNRRDFLKISYSASMGLMIGVALPGKNRLLGENLVQETFDPNIWSSIQSNNIINIVTVFTFNSYFSMGNFFYLPD